jgi:hypothetical protein
LPPPRGYPASWATVWINREGRAWWAQRQRLFGVAFAHQWLGLRPTAPGQWHVYLDHILIGLLVAKDRAGMRPLQLRAHQSRGGLRPPLHPSTSSLDEPIRRYECPTANPKSVTHVVAHYHGAPPSSTRRSGVLVSQKKSRRGERRLSLHPRPSGRARFARGSRSLTSPCARSARR